MKHPFKPGDLVQLKFGGLVMTVAGTGYTYYNYASSRADEAKTRCVWFDYNGAKQEDDFLNEMLVLADGQVGKSY